MSSVKAFVQIKHYIKIEDYTLSESPLLNELKKPFNPIIESDNINENYDFLITNVGAYDFGNINFSEVGYEELQQLKNQYNSKNDFKKQLIILFMLLIVRMHDQYYDIFDEDNTKYKKLLNPLILPPDPKEKCVIPLILQVNKFFTHEFKQNSIIVVQSINSYINQINNDNCIYNFLPFLIGLLDTTDQILIQNFINSDLFIKIIGISQKELPIFDFYRHFLYKFTTVSFRKTLVTQSMLDNFFDNDRNTSIESIFGKAIKELSDYPEILKEILVIFSYIISVAHEKGKEKSSLVFRILPCIDFFFGKISPEIDLSSFFEAVATFAVYSENEVSFELLIDDVRKLMAQKPSFMFQLRKNHNFFEILSKCKKKINYKYLINFAKITSGEMILLYQAIYVLLSLIQNIPEDEENIASSLFELSKNNGNIIELDRAKVPDFILRRLPIVQDKEEIREIYLQLFQSITSVVYHKTVFYHTIELLKNPDFKYSCDLLKVINKQLETFLLNNNLKNHNYSAFQYRREQLILHNTPYSFFRFDNLTGCGIISPKVTLKGSFSFCFWIRFNEMESINDRGPISTSSGTYVNPKEMSLVYLNNEDYKLDLFLQNSKLYLRYSVIKNSMKNLLDPTPFDYDFEQGRWYFINFTFKKKILYTYNSKLDIFNDVNEHHATNKISFSFYPNDYQLYICRKFVQGQLEIDQPSLICDMSAFLFIENNIKDLSKDRQLLIDYLSLNEFNINSFPNLLFLFNPSQSQENICFNVNKNALQVPFSGRIVPIIPNFCDVIQNISAINSFLPLITCLSDDKDGDKGSNNLYLILSILSNIINICEDSLLRGRFFESLVSFLYHCESLIDEEIFKVLFDMFLKIQNHELQKSIITSIFLNHDFFEKLDESIQSFFISHSPFHLYRTKEFNNKIVFDDLTLIIYNGVKYHNEMNSNSECYWNFVSNLCLDSPNDTNISFLIDIMCSNKSEFVAFKILQILLSIFSDKNDVSNYNDFTPYIITYSQYHDSMGILKLVIEIIKSISIKTNTKDNIYTTIFHLMIVFRPSLEILQESVENLIDIVFKMVKNDEMICFLPFLVILMENCKSKELNQDICEQFVHSKPEIRMKIPEMPFWTYWITKLFLQAYDPNPNENPREFADLCILCLNNLNISVMINLLNFFEIYNGLVLNTNSNDYQNTPVNFTSLKEIILIYLIKNISDSKKYYSYVYNFMLFSIQTVKDESKSSHLSYLGNFVSELFRNYDINVSLKDSVNQELLNLLIGKTETSFTNFSKVQLCGNKIEVSYKDVNSYLKNILDNNTTINNENNVEESEKYTKINKEILLRCLPDYKNYFKNDLVNTLEWIKGLTFTLNIRREYREEEEEAPIEKKLLSVSDTEKFDYYYVNYPKFIAEQETKVQSESDFLYKMKNSFMMSISIIPGPWENPNKNNEVKHFKILNRVTKSGKKILMRINKAFNNHSDASSNRTRVTTINPVDKHIYKTLETIPRKKLNDYFTTEVLISSQSKEEENGFLTASEEFITLRNKSSNILIYWEEIEFILNRKSAHIDNSCEIFKNNGRSYFLNFPKNERKSFYSFIDKSNIKFDTSNYETKFDFFKSLRFICKNIHQNKELKTIFKELKLTDLWKKRKITTFSYLYYLNILGGRSYNDIHQYLMYPFICIQSTEDNLLLESETSYRDLSKPIATLCEDFLRFSIHKYDEITEFNPYLFGELPLPSLAVTWYLIRTEPFTTIHVTRDQQFGRFPKFDQPERLFDSINGLINLMLNCGISKEIIPEFFNFPFFLINENDFDLGEKSDNKKVDNIELPIWSNNYYTFVSVLRLMLEGNLADDMICKWIDLMFGVKRRTLEYHGREYNLYKPYLYPETPDENFREEVIQCGSMPEQLFFKEHPQRDKIVDGTNIHSIDTQIQDKDFDPINQARFIKNILVSPNKSKVFELRIPTKENPLDVVPISLNNIFCGEFLCFSKCLNLAIFGTKTDPFLTAFNIKTQETKIVCHIPFIITSVCLSSGRFLITGGKDCSIRVWDLQNATQMSSSGFHSDIITSIACCYDNGLLVSADESLTLVFETMIDHVFINSVSLIDIEKKLKKIDTSFITDRNKDDDSVFNDFEFDAEMKNLFSPCTSKKDILNNVKEYKNCRQNKELRKSDFFIVIPQIVVFKSGIVAVAIEANVFFLDSRGKVIKIECFESEVVEMKKCYDQRTREFLIIGIKPDKIYVMDVASMASYVYYVAYFSSITTIQKSNSFITYYKGKISTFDFRVYVNKYYISQPESAIKMPTF
ncbi:hypothetical protein M9Y10_015130 [Tritrichomonas musculus]|uniref:Beige/BEACH domain containing protein n=1 Tax=Tritrichomonas musculus TaxID=1915356 RepID=A0ABR2L1E7_9EUKA